MPTSSARPATECIHYSGTLLQVAKLILTVLDGLKANGEAGNAAVEAAVKQEVAQLCQQFPVY